MKTIIVLTSLVILSFSHHSTAQTEEPKKMPPMKMLPKNGESKTIYELPKNCAYKVFDLNGRLYDEGEGEWIDMGKYEKGDYFIKYDDETVSVEIKK